MFWDYVEIAEQGKHQLKHSTWPNLTYTQTPFCTQAYPQLPTTEYESKIQIIIKHMHVSPSLIVKYFLKNKVSKMFMFQNIHSEKYDTW